MQNLSDDELDDLLRKANESQSHPYDADAWKALSVKLDSAPRSALARWKTPLAGVTIVLISSLFWIAYLKTERDTLDSAIAKPTEHLVEPSVKSSTPDTEAPTPADQKTAERLAARANPSNDKSLGAPIRVANRTHRTIESSAMATTDLSANVATRHEDGGLEQDTDTRAEMANTSAIASQEASNTPVKTEADSTSAESKEEVSTVQGEGSEKEVEDEKEEKSKHTFGPVAFRLSVSPDWSAVQFGKTYRVGANYGLLVEYPIGKSFSVSTGILYSAKNYTAENLQYGGYTAEFAQGACRMWDIPVNVHYYLPTAGRYRFFGTLGMSSYLMANERYRYFPDAGNSYTYYDDEFQGENKDWFRIVNASVGLQIPIAPRCFLLVEPFIKAPVAGVGEWDISLSSLGTFVSLKFQPKK